MQLGDHHPALIRVHLDHIALLDRQAAALEDEIEAALDAIPAAQGISAGGVPAPDPGPDAAVPPVSGSPRSPASAPASPGRSSPRPGWT